MVSLFIIYTFQTCWCNVFPSSPLLIYLYVRNDVDLIYLSYTFEKHGISLTSHWSKLGSVFCI